MHNCKAFFIERESSVSRADIENITSLLDKDKQYVPVSVDGPFSYAFGVVEEDVWEKIETYLEEDLFRQELLAVLSDMNKETADCVYHFAGIETFLTR